MLLIKDKKKNKQPHFRQMVPRKFVFQHAEEAFKCPLTKDGLINRRYSASCRDEIATEDVKIKAMTGENYEDKKKAYIGKILQDTKTAAVAQKQKEVIARGKQIYKLDELVVTEEMRGYVDDINATESPPDCKAKYIKLERNLNPIQIYILTQICYQKLSSFCDGRCNDAYSALGSSTFPKGAAILDKFKKEKQHVADQYQTEGYFKYIEFDPLVSAFMLDFWSDGVKNFQIPFNNIEDECDSDDCTHTDPWAAFYEAFTDVQSEKWYDEEAEGHKKYFQLIPEDPFMFYMFVTDEENREVLSPQLRSIVDVLCRSPDFDEWQPEKTTKTKESTSTLEVVSGGRSEKTKESTSTLEVVSGGRSEKRDIEYPDYDDERKEIELQEENSLKPLPYGKFKNGGTAPLDLSQGVKISDQGKSLFLTLVGSIIVRSAYDIHFDSLKLDMNKFNESLKELDRDDNDYEQNKNRVWAELFLQAYEWACETQENHFKTYKEWIPYSLSEWGANGGIFPEILHHELQSLSHLNVRLYGTRPVVCACPQGYETYYGAKLTMVTKKRPGLNVGDNVGYGAFFTSSGKTIAPGRGVILKKDGEKILLNIGTYWIPNKIWVRARLVFSSHANTTGICTKTLDDLLDVMETDEEKNNPWYIKWVGTYEQAARRIVAFKKKQAEMYDNNDPNYSFVSYYTNLILMNLDYWVKRLFNICNVKVDESGDENKPVSEEEAKFWGGVFDEIEAKWVGLGAGAGAVGAVGAVTAGAFVLGTGGLGAVGIAGAAAAGALVGGLVGVGGKELLGKVYTAIKAGGMILYKLFTMVLQMPFIQELILDMVTDYKDKICRKMAIAENRVKIRRTDGKGDVKQFNDQSGAWESLSPDEKLAHAKAIADESSKKTTGMINKFTAAIQSLSGAEGDGIVNRAAGAVSMNQESSPIKKVFKLLYKIPGVEKMLTFLHVTPDNLTAMLTVALTKTCARTWNSLVNLNSGMGRIMRLYDSIAGDGGCLDDSGNLVITDGGTMSKGGQYCSYAFEQALHNIPYYAMMVLNALHKDKWNIELAKPVVSGDKETYTLSTTTTRGEYVIGHDDQVKKTKAAGGKIFRNKQNENGDNLECIGCGTEYPWLTQYNLQLQNLIDKQTLPCGHEAHKKQDDGGNWDINKKTIVKFYESQLNQFNTYQHQQKNRAKSSIGPAFGSPEFDQTRAKEYALKEGFQDKVVQESYYVASQMTDKEKAALKKIELEAAKGWTAWQITGLVLAAAVGVAVVVAAGGPVAALAGAKALAAAAASTVAKNAGELKETVVEHAGKLKDAATKGAKYVYQNGAKVLEKGYDLANKVKDSYLGKLAIEGGKKGLQVGIDMGKNALTKVIGDTMKQIISKPDAAMALLFTGGTILMGLVSQAMDAINHFGDKYKCMPMTKLFAEQPVWDAIFRKKMALKIDEFIGVMGSDATKQGQHTKALQAGPVLDLAFDLVIRIKLALQKCVGFAAFFDDDMFWQFIDLEGTAEFFEQYAEPECFMKKLE